MLRQKTIANPRWLIALMANHHNRRSAYRRIISNNLTFFSILFALTLLVFKFKPSTITFSSLGNDLITFPCFPLSLPAIILTLSPFLIFINYYKTSEASEIILLKPLAFNSLATGPKILVPRGSLVFLSTITPALSSKRI